MALPQRVFFTLHEASARWGCSIADIAGWAAIGKPKIMIGIGLVRCGDAVIAGQVALSSLSFPAQSVEVSEATTGAGGGRIRIDKPDLFGGESREGGFVGDVDVLMGGPGQGPNDYLAARMGGDIPAYRGLCSLVLRQAYLGINPYLKPWAVRVTRVLTGKAGAAQWYPEKAAIVAGTALVAMGYVQASDIEPVIGALLTIGSVVWSVADKRAR